MTSPRLTGRHFLRASATAVGALAFPHLLPASAWGANARSSRITLAMIGTGNQGFQEMGASCSSV